MKLSKHAKFWALGALGGVGLFALGVFAQQTLEINPSEQDLFSDLKAVFFLDRNGDEIKSIVRWNASGSTLVTAPTSELTGGEAKNTLQNNASIIGSTDSSNTSAGAFLIATNGGKVEWESMQSFIWGANNTTLSGFNTIAVATKDTNINADNALALASKNTNITAKDAIAIGWEDIKLKGQASLAIWSKIDSAAQGAMVFNAKNEQLNLNNESNNTFVINAENGLIVNTNTSANPKIQLTVNGAIKLWEVNNAPAQASPYISTKKVGNVICICGKVNNGNIAISKYSRNNKQHAEICQKVCNNESPTLPGQCGAAATNYPLGQTQWSTDDFCQWGIGYAWAKPTFPALGGQTTWTCESFPSGGVNCTATRKGCGDGIRAAGEQCDLGTNNGKPDSNCSASCENIKAPKCWANAKTYLGSDVAWAQPNGFCTDDSVLGEATPAFWNGSTSGQKTWTCKNKNNKNLTCSATKQPPMVAGECNKNKVNICISGVFSGETSLKNGTRWTCKGEHGGSSKTCSTCDSGYTYNETSTKCEANCANPIYRHTNGVTIKAADCAEAGKEYLFEGLKYYVARDKGDTKAKIAADAYPANRIVTTRVTDMSWMFYQNSSFNQDIGNWDTSKVTDMSHMFDWAEAFNQPINNWDTSKVTDMSYMFRRTYSFNQPLNNWDTSKVTNMWEMFYWAYSFNQPLNNRRINQISNENLKDMFSSIALTIFRTNQPYCSWANWSAKKWNFVNMGLNECVTPPSKVNGQCKAYPWNHASQPATATANACVAGDYQDIPDDANNWKWKCNGKNGGTSIECSASKQSTCPSGFTASNGECIKWKCETTPASSTPAKCEGNYEEISYSYQGKLIISSSNESSFECYESPWSNKTIRRSCCTPFPRNKGQTSPQLPPPPSHQWPQRLQQPGFHAWQQTPWRQTWLDPYCWWKFGVWGHSDPTSTVGVALAVPGPQMGVNEFSAHYSCTKDPEKFPDKCIRKQRKNTGSCSLFTQTKCEQTNWCNRISWTTTPAINKYICIDKEQNIISDNECVNAGLPKSCIHTCPSGFTTHNGKCIRLQCKDTTPGKCEGNYQKITNKYQGEMIGRWRKWGLTTLACYLPSTPAPSNDCCHPLNPPSSLPDQRKTVEWEKYHNKYFPWSTHCWSQVGMWGYPDGTSEKGFSTAVPAPDRNWYIVYAACTKDPEKHPSLCKKSQRTQTISCESLNQTQCDSKSWCYRTTAASRKTICVDDQWNTAPDSLCSDAGLQLSCTSSVNGQCKTYQWAHTSQPATVTANGCVAGEYEDIADDINNYKWKCKGKGWGEDKICEVVKLIDRSEMMLFSNFTEFWCFDGNSPDFYRSLGVCDTVWTPYLAGEKKEIHTNWEWKIAHIYLRFHTDVPLLSLGTNCSLLRYEREDINVRTACSAFRRQELWYRYLIASADTEEHAEDIVNYLNHRIVYIRSRDKSTPAGYSQAKFFLNWKDIYLFLFWIKENRDYSYRLGNSSSATIEIGHPITP